MGSKNNMRSNVARKAATGRWQARGAALNLRKFTTPASIPAEVLARLASMNLPPDPALYNETLQRLLSEHTERCCNAD